MKNVLRKTLGGLNSSYYFRHFIFGAVISGLLFYLLYIDKNSTIYSLIGMGVSVTFLALMYPFSRFVWESVFNFIMGNNIIIMNALFLYFLKMITMTICYFFSIIIAPIGWIYLYFYHTKNEKNKID